MKPSLRFGLVLACSVAGAACSETDIDDSVRSLERSSAVSFVCLSADAAHDPGRAIDGCPDFDDLDEDRDLYALVTQTQRGELAVVNMSTLEVVDSDPWVPGVTFLPVGENPVDVVSTPGGVATFVASAGGPHQQGIFALPSSCVRRPRANEARRDLARWPACALPAAPGRMAVLVDPADAEGRQRETCTSEYVDPAELPAPIAAQDPSEAGGDATCEADLRQENAPPGRRKLAVTLPDVGEIWLLDAQRLLDVTPGAFPACADVALEGVVALATTLPDPLPAQDPGDLAGAEACLPPLAFAPPPDTYTSRPAGIEVRDGVLYAADLGVPLLHRIDVANPCRPSTLAPLVPRSFEEPGRTVFASSVAASPATIAGSRFVYAVDDQQGSLMVFDVSPGSAETTPLVRPGMRRTPFEIPDRLAFGSPVKDVEFAFRDLPAADPITGVANTGLLCDPDPALAVQDPNDPALEHRPDGNYREGARPYRLRGTFGFALLANGAVAVVDVEDLDAPCRRPLATNPDREVEDALGCRGDPAVPGGLFTSDGTRDGEPTVTGEQSCHVITPHRSRSARPFASTAAAGVSAPSLRSFPQLRGPTGGSLPTNQTEEGLANPKLLAVDFSDGSPAIAYLGTTLHSSGDAENALETDPTIAERNGVGFIFREPRAFPANDDVGVVYEGALVPERTAGILTVAADGAEAELSDPGGAFCARGVQDRALAGVRADELGVAAEDRAEFSAYHADYVQVTSAVPAEDDPYWAGLAQGCGGADPSTSRYTCLERFGTPEDPQPGRDLVVREAYQGRLVVEPRPLANGDGGVALDLLDCCFGGEALAYVVRGGNQWLVLSASLGFQHAITAQAGDLRCVADCNPRRALARSRLVEVAHSALVDAASATGIESCAVGECLACTLPAAGPIPNDSPCVFENATHRFAVYRGSQRSVRDMAFAWQHSGGFVAMSASLTSTTTAVSPLSLQFVPQIQELAVTDGSSLGLVFVSLDGVNVHTSFE